MLASVQGGFALAQAAPERRGAFRAKDKELVRVLAKNMEEKDPWVLLSRPTEWDDAMVEQGFGITILPKLLLHNAPFEVCIRSFTEHYTRTLGIALPSGVTPSKAVLQFRAFAKRWCEENLGRRSD